MSALTNFLLMWPRWFRTKWCNR